MRRKTQSIDKKAAPGLDDEAENDWGGALPHDGDPRLKKQGMQHAAAAGDLQDEFEHGGVPHQVSTLITNRWHETATRLSTCCGASVPWKYKRRS